MRGIKNQSLKNLTFQASQGILLVPPSAGLSGVRGSKRQLDFG